MLELTMGCVFLHIHCSVFKDQVRCFSGVDYFIKSTFVCQVLFSELLEELSHFPSVISSYSLVSQSAKNIISEFRYSVNNFFQVFWLSSAFLRSSSLLLRSDSYLLYSFPKKCQHFFETFFLFFWKPPKKPVLFQSKSPCSPWFVKVFSLSLSASIFRTFFSILCMFPRPVYSASEQDTVSLHPHQKKLPSF